MAKRDVPEINAGSMADIAFLLLIFFLVTTTMDVDTGISRKLPEKQPPDAPEPPKLKEKNVFVVTVNRNNDILVEGETFMTIDQIREEAIKFIDNGGGLGNPIDGAEPAECDWCEGAKDPASSDHPNKAVISLESDRGTSYGTYISVQNELVGAYTDLRNRLSEKMYGVSYTQMLKDQGNNPNNETLKERIKIIKGKYPQIISEAEPTK
ncbi:biopolymer transporter ExbD [Lutimonas saemankumensis]|uniref:ExbD/TolR family protein n=1 Tax=Lutimonas saemankumensis TaxID=483016 RepID=UPI001CD4BC38|nr:biopolymer transporter ExbD [Lutimonas saemankumensis]MCA0933226.1 biopolymer transporter ExbD [Lutimonas saemankumensis]